MEFSKFLSINNLQSEYSQLMENLFLTVEKKVVEEVINDGGAEFFTDAAGCSFPIWPAVWRKSGVS